MRITQIHLGEPGPIQIDFDTRLQEGEIRARGKGAGLMRVMVPRAALRSLQIISGERLPGAPDKHWTAYRADDSLSGHLTLPSLSHAFAYNFNSGVQALIIRAYANGWYQGPRDPRFFAERAREVVAMGYTALKFDPFGNAYRFISGDELRRSLAIVGAVREAVGEGIELLIEAQDRFSVSTAVEIGRALAEFKPFWYEAPVMSSEIEALAEVARAVPVRVVAGERSTSKGDFARLLHTRVIDVVQPEILHCCAIPVQPSRALSSLSLRRRTPGDCVPVCRSQASAELAGQRRAVMCW